MVKNQRCMWCYFDSIQQLCRIYVKGMVINMTLIGKVIDGDFLGNDVCSNDNDSYAIVSAYNRSKIERLISRITVKKYVEIGASEAKADTANILMGGFLLGTTGAIAAASNKKATYDIAILFRDGKKSIIRLYDNSSYCNIKRILFSFDDDLNQPDYSVILKQFGKNESLVITAIKSILGVDFKEVVAIVDNPSKIIVEAVPLDYAVKIKERLENIGAVIELEVYEPGKKERIMKNNLPKTWECPKCGVTNSTSIRYCSCGQKQR